MVLQIRCMVSVLTLENFPNWIVNQMAVNHQPCETDEPSLRQFELIQSHDAIIDAVAKRKDTFPAARLRLSRHTLGSILGQ